MINDVLNVFRNAWNEMTGNPVRHMTPDALRQSQKKGRAIPKNVQLHSSKLDDFIAVSCINAPETDFAIKDKYVTVSNVIAKSIAVTNTKQASTLVMSGGSFEEVKAKNVKTMFMTGVNVPALTVDNVLVLNYWNPEQTIAINTANLNNMIELELVCADVQASDSARGIDMGDDHYALTDDTYIIFGKTYNTKERFLANHQDDLEKLKNAAQKQTQLINEIELNKQELIRKAVEEVELKSSSQKADEQKRLEEINNKIEKQEVRQTSILKTYGLGK